MRDPLSVLVALSIDVIELLDVLEAETLVVRDTDPVADAVVLSETLRVMLWLTVMDADCVVVGVTD